MGRRTENTKVKQKGRPAKQKKQTRQAKRKPVQLDIEEEIEDFQEDLMILLSKDLESGQFFAQIALYPSIMTSGVTPGEALIDMANLLDQAVELAAG